MKRTCALLMIVAGLALWARPAAAVPPSWVDEQVQVIAGHQLADGAIVSQSPNINPYFANIAAIGLARANTPASDAALLGWMSWHLGHLNGTDVNGLHDTIYDYTYDPSTGAESSTGTYDSVDSYASTALDMAYLAYLTGDGRLRNLVQANIGAYEAIANLEDYSAPVGLRQPDGLTLAKPGSFEYTMDNAEVAGGLADLSRLEGLLGRSQQSGYYGDWAKTSRDAMVAKLWNAGNANWDWALGSPSDPAHKSFYPDAGAQIWPVIFGVVAPGSSQATAAWSAFTGAYPDWFHDQIRDSFPWASMARAGQLMGHAGDSDTLLTTIHGAFAPGWSGNWYDAEAGWFIVGATASDP